MEKISMDTGIQIVPMEEKHIPALAQLERLCFSQPWTENGLRSELGNRLAVFCVAEQNGQVLGYAGMHCVMGECYINNIAVFPQYRGSGIGTRLVQELIGQAIQRDGLFLTLEVRASNEQAVSLYQRLGFYKAGCRKNFYTAPTEDGLIMTKDLKQEKEEIYEDTGN